ncbi:DedA family protein [Salmonella enterica subsp. enterica serovar Schwarzengrund]|uniref:DedA family protein n=16 Tax=Salmonella enterica TaxID=28901 RepID=A0A620DI50_SALER|nr:Inner membrane protein yohD [Salmonella enterica subsp. enterica serovar Montevideo str. USDA-ARS-USMARC-1903]AKD12147.1 DedA family protein [Salmonella enterica subsp. enterica serovar Montevideo str. CDC 86-0391]APW14811.1 DedA family protein [Salmonella enterica subsp. enterica serovar Muenster str. 0315]APW69116.1 DedA family protein [Salmonella enterica subsp. enterica serovar Antsalova str. S01-0511]ATT60885.1 DedA family protein [Salmonella enterica subsp. enterica serovar Montevideo 
MLNAGGGLRMDINTLITHYGYAALVIGSMAEGETVTLLGGVAAHQGLLKFPLVAAAVALGGMMGDQLLYLLGRCYGGKILRRFPRYHTKIRRAQKMIQRHPYLFVIGTRFMYGFRVVGPLLIGASRLPPKIFLPLNIVGALIWALLFTTLGYLGGEMIAPWLHDLDQHLRHGVWLILAIVLVVGVRWWLKSRGKAEAR